MVVLSLHRIWLFGSRAGMLNRSDTVAGGKKRACMQSAKNAVAKRNPFFAKILLFYRMTWEGIGGQGR